MDRPLPFAAVLLVLAGCSFEPAAATLTVAAVGEPAAGPIGGYRLEAQLMTDDVVDGSWEPKVDRAISIAPGRHVVVLRLIAQSDVVMCIDSVVPGEGGCKRQEEPPAEVCRMTVDLAPGSETVLPIALDSGPECRVAAT